ncbi:MAG: hypothetical protein K2K77_04630 [Duncaniella sp.]|nr:hypothetical protein [Duncaniella sp.]
MKINFSPLLTAISQTLAVFFDTVMDDLNRVFARFRIWSFISIPFTLSFMCLKWSILFLLLPVSFIINLTKSLSDSCSGVA